MDSVISKRIFQERVPCKHQIDSFNWMTIRLSNS